MDKDPRKLPESEVLAKTFAVVIVEWLTPYEFMIMRMRNSRQTNPCICHSHDFIDANMAMDEAFKRHGIDPLDNPQDPEGGMTKEVNDLWNETWDLAKRIYFS